MEKSVFRSDDASILQMLTEGKELEKWQNFICDVANVFICCVDSRGTPLTPFGGNPDEVGRVLKAIDREQLQNTLYRISDSTLEDQAIENCGYPNFRLAVITARRNGRTIFSWLVCGVLSDIFDVEDYPDPPLLGFKSTLKEKEFYRIMDSLRDISGSVLAYHASLLKVKDEEEKRRGTEDKMKAVLKRTEVLAEIFQLIESNDPIEGIMIRLLRAAGSYLDISTACLCRTSGDGEKVEVAARWCKKGIGGTMPEMEEIKKRPFFLKTEKALILSGDSLFDLEEQEELDELNIKAIVVLPVMVGGSVCMYACFDERERERNWQVEEIKFLNDSVKVLQNILTRREHKSELSESYASFEAVLDHMENSVYVRSLSTGQEIFVNRSMRCNFGPELSDGSLYELLQEEISKEKGGGEIFLARREKWYELVYARMKWLDKSPVLFCSLQDETEKKIYQKKLEQQANIDFLTGLYNRMCCEKDLAGYAKRAKEDSGRGALLYLDLDDFKNINEGLGHQYGDMLLKTIAHNLRRIQGIEDSCYRMGGDEFIIIVPPDSFGRLEAVTEKVREIFMRPWMLRDKAYYCTMSMGIVIFPDEGGTVQELIQKADIAMYEAKREGKNRSAVYTDQMGSESFRRLDMEKNMRNAAEKGYQEFEIYFQPIVNIRKKGKPCEGAEALVRWNSLELGFLSPTEFIPLAEYLGLINPIGSYVLREACAACKGWNDNGHPNYRVNVNLSVVQLLSEDIVEIIRKALRDSGLKPRNLMLEVTEGLAINDMERMKEILVRIKKLGVKIALDDFGTGYSSLNHIRELPFDVIKVDQGFITNLERDVYEKSFVRMMSELAESIGVSLCVEGVETQGQYDILANMQVNTLQGFYFDKPLSRECFEEKYVNKPQKTIKIDGTDQDFMV